MQYALLMYGDEVHGETPTAMSPCVPHGPIEVRPVMVFDQ